MAGASGERGRSRAASVLTNVGRRSLIPATWYQEPNWETGKNIWWQLCRADGLPWMLAGIWNRWTDPATGEILPSYKMLTCNCDGHPMLARLHKPDRSCPPTSRTSGPWCTSSLRTGRHGWAARSTRLAR